AKLRAASAACRRWSRYSNTSATTRRANWRRSRRRRSRHRRSRHRRNKRKGQPMSQSMTINTATVAGGLRRQFLQGVGGVLLAAGLLGLAAAPALAGEPIKVVYHIADGVDQASHALGNLRNELRGEPDTKIVVVALGAGLNFLLQGAKDRNGEPFAPAISALAAQ